MQGRALAGRHQNAPVAVDIAELLLILNTFVEIAKTLLIFGVAFQRVERRLGCGFRFRAAGCLVALRKSFSLLLGRFAFPFSLVILLFESDMLAAQVLNLGERLLPCLFDLHPLLPQLAPRAKHGEQRVRLVVLFGHSGLVRRQNGAAANSSLVLCLQPFDFGFGICPGALQILCGVVHLILVQLQLRLSHVELILQIFFL